MAWQLVPAAVTLREQVNAKWPNRDKASDGSIGDAAHAARVSDHNPVNGWVHAIDIDKDGIDADAFADQLIAHARNREAGSDRLKNVVWKDRVASGTYADKFWVWRPGNYGHFDHIHISFTETAEHDSREFPLPIFTASWTVVTKLKGTGVYALKSEKSKRIAWRLPGFPVKYVKAELDSQGRKWLKTPAGNWIIASATRAK